MSRGLDFDPFVHPPLQAEQRERLRAEGAMGPADRELTFDQFLDVINPLQHIPVVGTLYRAVTGDTLDSSASVVGSLIYGGPIGLVAGMAGAVVQQVSGRDIGGLALAALSGDEPGAPDVAAAATAPEMAPEMAHQTAPEIALAGAAGSGAAAATAVAGTGGGAAAPAAGQEPPPAAASRDERAEAGRVLEGDDALAALAADLRAAVDGRGGAAPASKAAQAAGRPVASAALRAARAEAAESAGDRIPPAESFMALNPRDFGGPELATRMSAEHAADALPLGTAAQRQAGLHPAGPDAAAASPGGSGDAAQAGRRAGSIGGGPTADRRVAGGIAPQSSFTERMMEALNKYRALSDEGSTAVN